MIAPDHRECHFDLLIELIQVSLPSGKSISGWCLSLILGQPSLLSSRNACSLTYGSWVLDRYDRSDWTETETYFSYRCHLNPQSCSTLCESLWLKLPSWGPRPRFIRVGLWEWVAISFSNIDVNYNI